jgi:hypothetical protein
MAGAMMACCRNGSSCCSCLLASISYVLAGATNYFSLSMAIGAEEEDVMRVGKRVYVSNLAWRTSWQDLKDKFREAGTVVYSNVIRYEDGERGEGARHINPVAFFVLLASSQPTATALLCRALQGLGHRGV